MWRYNYTPSSDELYHHGIMGMKWGKRNGPPYPLDSSQKSSAEKKKSEGSSGSGKATKKQAKNKAKSDKYINRHTRFISEKSVQDNLKYTKDYYDKVSDPKKGRSYVQKMYGDNTISDTVYKAELSFAKDAYIEAIAESNLVKSMFLDRVATIDTSSISFKEAKNLVDQYLTDYVETLGEEQKKISENFDS